MATVQTFALDEAVASAELAQPAWTYPLCVACGAAILSRDQLDSTNRNIHWICPDTEHLATLPLVERAAIACSMVASNNESLCKALDIFDAALHDELDQAVLSARALTYHECMSYEDRHAFAEAMLRNGEVPL